MRELLKKIEKLSGELVKEFQDSGYSNDEAQDAVLVLIKEHMNPLKPNVKDMKDCISTLKLWLKDW